ncbi:glutamate-cysteine ligase family protein [Kineococcus esterisolvens]|uniref:glutamate-cysteine ligase family protein n=1 Tax=Kineococcus sp. SYSU DK029 TaxID=3383150 RepID=UPI003D7F0A90
MPALSSLEHAGEGDTGDRDVPLDVAAVLEQVAAGALRAGTPGTVGLELERHAVDLRAPLRRVPWDRLTGALRGVEPPAGCRLTLEPGGQVELSSPPLPGPAAAVAALQRDAAHVDAVLAADGIALLSTGTDPARPPERVNPGSRYSAMAEHFTAVGHGADGAAMMCSTASLQVNLEAGPAHRWPQRLEHLHRLLPVLAALSACSPLLAGRATRERSARQGVWRRLEPGRCTRPADGTGGPDPAGEWADFALAAPVMLVRDGEDAPCRPVGDPVSLADWAGGRRRLHGRAPTVADVDLHLSTLWPPVRMRGFLEVRVLDAVPAAWWPGLAAVVAAVVDDDRAADAAAAAAEPVAHRAADAARLGLADPALARAARGVLAAALPAVPTGLRGAVEAWAELTAAGRGPADLVLDRARRSGPTACLTAEELR